MRFNIMRTAFTLLSELALGKVAVVLGLRVNIFGMWNNDIKRREASLHSRKLRSRGKGVGEATFATVLAVMVEGHKNASTAFGGGTFTPQALDLSIGVDLVVLEDSHLDLLTLMLDFLGGVVSLLLALLGTSSQA